MKKRNILFASIALLLAPIVASAHANVFETAGFERIIQHLFTSVDHMLAMFGVTILAFVIRKTASSMLRYAGAAVGLAGIIVLIT